MPRRLLFAVAASLVLACSASAGSVPHWKAWLCMEGAPDDWCRVVLTTTVVPANGTVKKVSVPVPASPPIDCFYVYPTVSLERRPNSNLVVTPEERAVALTEAAYFSHVCRVFAPMYNQVTGYAGVPGSGVPQGNYNLEYTDVLAAFRDYLAHYNDGRGVILLGHSEGSFIIEELIEKEFPTFKKVFAGAILLGGDVNVDSQNRFHGIPSCTSVGETGCLIGYSSWDKTPPSRAYFEGAGRGKHVLCINPAALGGGSSPIDTIFGGINPEGIVPNMSNYHVDAFVEFPELYSAKCVQQGQRAWLLVSRIHHPGDKRPEVAEVKGKNWGLHPADVNLTLGNLVSDVAAQSKSWLRSHR